MHSFHFALMIYFTIILTHAFCRCYLNPDVVIKEVVKYIPHSNHHKFQVKPIEITHEFLHIPNGDIPIEYHMERAFRMIRDYIPMHMFDLQLIPDPIEPRLVRGIIKIWVLPPMHQPLLIHNSRNLPEDVRMLIEMQEFLRQKMYDEVGIKART